MVFRGGGPPAKTMPFASSTHPTVLSGLASYRENKLRIWGDTFRSSGALPSHHCYNTYRDSQPSPQVGRKRVIATGRFSIARSNRRQNPQPSAWDTRTTHKYMYTSIPKPPITNRWHCKIGSGGIPTPGYPNLFGPWETNRCPRLALSSPPRQHNARSAGRVMGLHPLGAAVYTKPSPYTPLSHR